MNNKAFTLIELLVVVLIIGILASVALPQYQKVVEKSRAMEAVQLIKTVSQAVDVYYLANGTWPLTFEELAIDIPWTQRETGYIPAYITDVRSNGKWSIQLHSQNEGYYSILATRLDGKYKGAAFMVRKQLPAGTNPLEVLNAISCVEFLTGNNVFTASAGSFCTQIMKGTEIVSNQSNRIYSLPF
jgi:type II secretion system protein G